MSRCRSGDSQSALPWGAVRACAQAGELGGSDLVFLLLAEYVRIKHFIQFFTLVKVGVPPKFILRPGVSQYWRWRFALASVSGRSSHAS